MPHSIKILFFMLILLTACTEKKSTKNSTDAENIQLKEEIETTEALTKELEDIESELEQKSKELEDALKEIDN